MNTPICDFVQRYAAENALRLHMPGHKGVGPLGVESLDITEISGADSLYEADGIIQESESNASALFGCKTLYSTEGSSLCIRAMLYLALLHGRETGARSLVYAARNVHKTFLSAAALLDLDVKWLYGSSDDSYLCCRIDARELDKQLASADEKPFAVYITSPDYLGNVADIPAIAQVCKKHHVLLLVDNAHGAYLKFLPESLHPVDLGADLCCDSAHKTLPVLTGGAYLHISPSAPEICSAQAKNALALFGSTSPSYLIMQSLDAANKQLAGKYPMDLAAFLPRVHALCKHLQEHGFQLVGNEALKITIASKAYGYSGTELSDLLLAQGIVSEFADPDFAVFMLTPEIGPAGLDQLEAALLSTPAKKAVLGPSPAPHKAQPVLSIREALFAPSEMLHASNAEGRILAAASVGCPPAVPIVVCGERIDVHALECFKYYGIDNLSVVKEA